MADYKKELKEVTWNWPKARNWIPFTSGVIIGVYAWFWPTGYGHWLGIIVKSFRDVNGW